jgi:choice-of-anchor C domain-containing protein
LMTILLLAFAARGASNLVVNGSFENYGKPPLTWTAPGFGDYGIPPGSTNVIGWQIVQAPIAYVRTWPGADSASSIDLSGDGGNVSGGVAQTLSTTAGQPYVLSFHMSGNPGASFPRDPSLKRMSVRVGELQQVFSYDTDVQQNSFADMKWQKHELLYVAGNNSTRIEFMNLMGTNLTGPVLDHVVFRECVPPDVAIEQAGQNVVVSWKDTVCPVVLEASGTVDGQWGTNAWAVVQSNGRAFVTNTVSGNRFFRLRLQ